MTATGNRERNRYASLGREAAIRNGEGKEKSSRYTHNSPQKATGTVPLAFPSKTIQYLEERQEERKTEEEEEEGSKEARKEEDLEETEVGRVRTH